MRGNRNISLRGTGCSELPPVVENSKGREERGERGETRETRERERETV